MTKIFIILIGLVISGCVSQPMELPQEERELHFFYEEPKIDYEDLGRIEATSRVEHPIEMLEKIRSRAAELGADGVIVHSIRHKGMSTGGTDTFGTGGGGSGSAIYQIQATAIRYIN